MKSNVAIIVSVIGVGITVAFLLYKNRYKRSRSLTQASPGSTGWQLIGSIGQIDIYPAKSCGSCSLLSSPCDFFGLMAKGVRDRSLIIINEDGEIAMAGQYPRMLSVKPEIIDDCTIVMRTVNRPDLIIDLADMIRRFFPKITYKKGKNYVCPLIECLEVHHKWFSETILERPTGLKLFIALVPSMTVAKSPSDYSPLMVMNKKSVEDLNRRLSERNQVSLQQFRGNLLIEPFESVSAYDEDNWMWMKISPSNGPATILRFSEICTRCIIPNINPETCERNVDYEPLRTLLTYRLLSHPKEPDMGVRFDVYQSGIINLGDPVYVQYKN